MGQTPPLAKPFLQAGKLTTKDIETIEKSLNPGEKFLSGLIRSKLIDDFQIAETLARYYRIPHLRLSTVAIDAALSKFVDREFALQHNCMPVRLDDDPRVLTIALEDPLDFSVRDILQAKYNTQVRTVLASHSSLQDAIRQFYGQGESLEKIIQSITSPAELDVVSLRKKNSNELLDLTETESQPVVKLVNYVILDAIRARASDIHMEPSVSVLKVRYRVDGVLVDAYHIPKWLQNGVISRIKILAEMDIAERRKPQDGRIEVAYLERLVDLRVSVLPTHLGEKIVLRILDTKAYNLTLDDLGFSADDLSKLKELVQKPQGMLLTTGPTGSGKSTTLYSCLNTIKSPQVNIITIENPVEYDMVGINQVQINEKAGLTFASTLRSVLRQDPNVIMVGEIRDKETAEIAIQAAMTGHLVLSTLHTNDAIATISRLCDLGIDSTLLGSSLVAILAQRLARRSCPDCQVPYTPEPEALRLLGYAQPPAGLTHGRGCEKCKGSGFSGRLGIYEMLIVDARMREAIGRHVPEAELRKVALASGMVPLLKQAANKVLANLTTAEEVTRVIQTEVASHNQCPSCNREVDAYYSTCPFCAYALRGTCANCGEELKSEWNICPHCRTPKGGLPASTLSGLTANITACNMVSVPSGTTGSVTSSVAEKTVDPKKLPTVAIQRPVIANPEPAVDPKKLPTVMVQRPIASPEHAAVSQPAPAPISIETSPELIGGQMLRVLIIDDDTDLTQMLSFFVKRVWGRVDVAIANGGEKGVEMAEKFSPHVIILDIMMPGMDGFEVCQKLRESIRTAFIPILMITASPKSEVQAQAIAVGADDFLSKPLLPAQLQDKLKRLLHRTYGL